MLSAFYVQNAAFDFSKTSPNDHSDCGEEDGSPILCTGFSPNTAMFHVQLLPLTESDVWLGDQSDYHFISVSLRLLQ